MKWCSAAEYSLSSVPRRSMSLESTVMALKDSREKTPRGMEIWLLNYPGPMEYHVHLGAEFPIVSAIADVNIQRVIHPDPFLSYHRATYEPLSIASLYMCRSWVKSRARLSRS